MNLIYKERMISNEDKGDWIGHDYYFEDKAI